MDKLHTVKKNYEFSDIIHTGKFAKNECYSLYIKGNGLSITRFGISVSKKLGNAVFRNKYKRQLRFIIDKNKVELFVPIRVNYVWKMRHFVFEKENFYNFINKKEIN